VGVNVTKAQLIKYICSEEGKKHQASVGDVREIINIIERMVAQDLFAKDIKAVEPTIFDRFTTAINKGVNEKLTKFHSKKRK
jgi:hypothetical protein